MVERARLRPAKSVGRWGIGGLGVHAVQIARLVGAAPVIAVDPSPVARERALERGADHALDPQAEDVPARIRELTGGGLDSPSTWWGRTRSSPRERCHWGYGDSC